MTTWQRLSILSCTLLATTSTALSQTPTSQVAASQPQPSDLVDRLLALGSPPLDWKEQARKRNASLPPGERDWFEGEPSEDAAPEVLLAYWSELCWDEDVNLGDMSEKLRRRILEATDQQPYDLMMVLRFIPDTPEAAEKVARMYETARSSGEPDNPEWFKRVLDWLGEHHKDYRAELITLARSARDRESWIENREALRALARVDWAAARPVLMEHADGCDTGVAALSLALLYRHAVASGSQDEAASLRERLKSLVANRKARDEGRSIACEALMATEWDGRDGWFLSLFADSSLCRLDSFYFLCVRPMPQPPALLAVVRDSPDYWIPRVATLLGNRDRAVHNAAVHCLVQYLWGDARADAIQPLLPWLFDQNWADDGPDLGRLRLIQSLSQVSMPQSVPGLIRVVEKNTGFKLAGAAEALAFYRTKDAIPSLKAALVREPDEVHRRDVIKALLALQAFSTNELLDAIEAYAAATSTGEGEAHFKKAFDHEPSYRLEVKLRVGYWVRYYDDLLGDAVVQKSVERASELRKQGVAHADRFWSIISRWDAKPIDAEILRRLASGKGDENSITSALRRRESLRSHVPDQLAALCDRGGMPSGVALVLLGDARRYPAVLESSDTAAQRALLACARLIRESLPIPMVAQLAKSKDERVSKAAWQYLEDEDSPAARQVVLARYPGQAKILGAFEGLFGDWEDELRKAVLANDGPDEIHALLSFSDSEDDIQRIIYVHGEKAELRVYRKTPAYTSQTLSRKQWRGLRSFLTANSVDDLAPLNLCVDGGVMYEYVHVTKDGGRRVFMDNPQTEGGSLYDRLVRRFKSLEATTQPPKE